jgi:uncharacterized protein YodC (DUF2158 family)
MRKQQFREGNIVRLNSGGAQMTVRGYSESGEVRCHWHDAQKKERHAVFSEKMLMAVPSCDLTDEQLIALALAQKGPT